MSLWHLYEYVLYDLDAFCAFGIRLNAAYQYKVWAARRAGGEMVIVATCETKEEATSIIDRIAKAVRGFA